MRTSVRLALPLSLLFFACQARVADAGPPAAPAPPGAPAVSSGTSFHYSHGLTGPATVQLAGVQGDIEATASSDGVLDVQATITGKNPARMKVVAREDTGGIAVCVLFAQDSPDDCRLGAVERHGHSHRHVDDDEDPDVRLVVRVPPGVTLVAGTLSGSISAHGLTGPVKASSLNGDVRVSTQSTAEAKTANGAVEVSFATPPTGPLSFETMNGRVTVDLPAGTNAAIDASTTNGEISANFPMTLHTLPMGLGPKEGHAQLGQGGPTLQAHTKNGDVVLRRHD
jgi:hypothetical protein